MALAVLAQFFGVICGPLEHWRNSTRLGPHWEEAGSTKSHYTHDEAKCVACAIHHMAASPARRATAIPSHVVRIQPTRALVAVLPDIAFRSEAAPRAPPARASIG